MSIRRCVPFLIFALSLAYSQNKPAPRPVPPVGVPTPSAESYRLPVRRVVLYKNGVGYFEHSARVRGTQDLNIDFTTSQLNDVLKSLTVVDLGEGRISSVRYNSIAPLSERLKGLRLPFGEQVGATIFSQPFAVHGWMFAAGRRQPAASCLVSTKSESRRPRVK
jgi:hypothetical protein